MSVEQVKNVVIVGGGSAGWLVAGILANRFAGCAAGGLKITLIESGEIPSLGVGEGTWPSMRSTLKKIGISETQFLTTCDASFKQGSKFISWTEGRGESYYHPFQLPAVFADDFVSTLDAQSLEKTYSECVCPQVALDARHLAPKLITSGDYAHVVNYGYHLDANKLGMLLREHTLANLGVEHLLDTVEGVQSDERGYIRALVMASGQKVQGDLFIDCSGFASILMKRHFQIPFIGCQDRLFNDSAIAVQIPYTSNQDPIQSYTLSTAQSAGWIWDIGLTSRRGVGYTYSSAHSTAEQAQAELEAYVSKTSSSVEGLAYRNIQFNPGHLEKFWHKNCVAIGVSSGFLEPLEASALVTIELAAGMLADNFPPTYSAMALMEEKFNQRFARHWEHIIEFLKLHYVLSRRQDSDYWRDNRHEQSLPAQLLKKLEFWRHFPPSRYDDIALQELFPAASYQYVLHGMGYVCDSPKVQRRVSQQEILRKIEEGWRSTANMARGLPTNRDFLTALKENSGQAARVLSK